MTPTRPLARARIAVAITAAATALLGAVLVAAPASATGSAASASATGSVASASTSDGTTCGYAATGTGTYAETLCWLDFSRFDSALATASTGQRLRFAIPGGYTLRATVTTAGEALSATALPTTADAYLGNGDHYTGIAGRPALYQRAEAHTSTVALTGISVTDSKGRAVSGFTLVAADAETTDGRERFAVTASSALRQLDDLGNACPAGFSGVGTTAVTCVGGATSAKTGAPLLAASSPASVSVSMTGRGLEGVAFGVLVSKVELSTSVSGAAKGDSFAVDVLNRSGATVASASTASASTASTGAVTLLAAASDSTYTLRVRSIATSAAYSTTWACTQNTVPATELPDGSVGTATSVAIHPGDFVRCAIIASAAQATPVTEAAADPSRWTDTGWLVPALVAVVLALLVAGAVVIAVRRRPRRG